MSWSIERKARAAFIAIALFVLATCLLAYLNAASFITANNLVGHTRDVRREITGAQTAMTTIQIGQAAYLLTADDSYLEKYAAAVTRLGERQKILRNLVADNPQRLARLDAVEPMIARWLELVNASVTAQQNGLRGVARASFSTSTVDTLLAQITAILNEMNEDENQLLQDRSAEAAERSQFTLATFILLTAVMVVLLAYGYYLIRRDLSRRREYEHLIRKERTLLRSVIDTVPDCIHVKDNELRFLLINQAQATLMGAATPDEVIGKRDGDYFPEEMVVDYTADERRIIATGQAMIEHEESSLGADGQMRIMLTTKVPVRSSSDEIIQIVGISRDITARKQTQVHIEQLNMHLSEQTSQLQAANKELEAFSYSVSHDLRAPLRAIDGFTRIVIEEHEAELPAEAMRYLLKVRTNSQRMGELIDDLLRFSRLSRQQLSKKIVHPAEIVRQIVDDDLREERERRQIEFNIGELPTVEADPLLLRQVYVNLLANAVKFTGKCDVARIDVGATQENGDVVYFVKDNGAGFDPQYKQKLFGVFQRLHRPEDYEGTGVGLAIVQRVVSRHGGRVWADGAVNQGATFYFTLGEASGEPNGRNPAR